MKVESSKASATRALIKLAVEKVLDALEHTCRLPCSEALPPQVLPGGVYIAQVPWVWIRCHQRISYRIVSV